MRLFTLAGRLRCSHGGPVRLKASQSLVFIAGSPVLVEPDPENRPITCPIPPAVGTKPCTFTLRVRQGYSTRLFIKGQPVCRDDIKGFTDGVPPGLSFYRGASAGQDFVQERA